jgi:DNA-binding CsgD family transcriptional regulator
LIGATCLSGLIETGLVSVSHSSTGRAVINVNPPLLAEIITSSAEPIERKHVRTRPPQRMPAPFSAGQSVHQTRAEPWKSDAEAAIARLHARASAEATDAQKQWRLDPGPRTALNLASGLLARGAPAEQINAVLTDVHRFESSDYSQTRALAMWEARWRAWHTNDIEGSIDALAKVRSNQPDPALDALQRHLESMAGIRSSGDTGWGASLELGTPGLAAALEHISAGRSVDAIALLEGVSVSASEALLYGYALNWARLMNGELSRVIDDTACLHATALERLDPQALVLYSHLQALALLFAGRIREMQAVLRSALGTGQFAFPFVPVQLSNLTMTAILQARSGLAQAAKMTVKQAQHFGIRYSFVPFASPEWASAYIEAYQGKGGASDRLWELGLKHESLGYIAAAAMSWALGVEWNAQQLEHAERVVAHLQGNLIAPMIRFQRALATRDLDALEQSWHELSSQGRYLYAAIAAAERAKLASEQADSSGADTWRERVETVSAQLGLSIHEITRMPTRLARLSEREATIVSRVADGLSNQQIAEDLVLSVRTVENHISRILKKLELSKRNELITAWQERSPWG